MKQIHVECLPDETLVRKLGFTRKNVVHHSGKSRVFHKLKSVRNQLALVDEDPGSAKTSYERSLTPVDEAQGIKLYTDSSGNKILFLEGKLEDWIIFTWKQSGIELKGLPQNPNELHNVINQRIKQLEDLIDVLAKSNSIGLNTLKRWLI